MVSLSVAWLEQEYSHGMLRTAPGFTALTDSCLVFDPPRSPGPLLPCQSVSLILKVSFLSFWGGAHALFSPTWQHYSQTCEFQGEFTSRVFI